MFNLNVTSLAPKTRAGSEITETDETTTHGFMTEGQTCIAGDSSQGTGTSVTSLPYMHNKSILNRQYNNIPPNYLVFVRHQYFVYTTTQFMNANNTVRSVILVH